MRCSDHMNRCIHRTVVLNKIQSHSVSNGHLDRGRTVVLNKNDNNQSLTIYGQNGRSAMAKPM